MGEEEKEESKFIPGGPEVALSKKDSRCSGFFVRLKSDNDYRQKFLDTVCLWMGEFVFGFVYGQAGPTLPDLRQITQVDLDTASWLFTSFSLGYLFGCFLAGVLEKATSPRLSMFVSLFGMALFTIATPWCSKFGLMLAARACAGAFFGGVDVGGHSFMFSIWRKDVQTYLQMLYFMLASGCLAAPFATTPFLSQRIEQYEFSKSQTNQSEYFTTLSVPVSNRSEIPYKIIDEGHSKSDSSDKKWNNSDVSVVRYTDTDVHFSFLICGILSLSVSIPFLIIHILKPTNNYLQTKKAVSAVKDANDKTQSRKVLYYLAIIIVTVMLSVRTGWTSTFIGFLTTFCSRHLEWTKPEGNLATSVFFIAYAIGSFLCIFLVQCLRPANLLMIFLLWLNASLVAFTAASTFQSDLGIWICVSSAGMAISATWPTVLTWTEDNVTPITGKIASLLLFSGAIGQMVNPIAVGYIMENVSNLGFAYWHLAEMVLITLLFVLVACLYRNVDSISSEQRVHRDKELEIQQPLKYQVENKNVQEMTV